MLVCWDFLTADNFDEFSFQLYNTSHSGTLSFDELKEVLLEIHGNKPCIQPILNAIFEKMKGFKMRIHARKDMYITKEEYLQHIKEFPTLIFPTFEVQVGLFCW